MRTSASAPWGALVVVALLSGLLWRAEVDLRGWDGLAWIGYFHLAVPASVTLFLAWVACFVDAPTRRHRVAVVASLALFAAMAIPATEWSLRQAFSRFALFWGPLWFGLWWWLLAPTTAAGLLVLCRTPPGWRRWLLAQALFSFAPFAATALATLFPQHGQTDFIHAVKGGLIAPLLVVSLGALIPLRSADRALRPDALA